MALTEEQIETLEQAATLIQAARRTIEDAVVLLTMARIFGPRVTGALIDVCINIEECECEAQIEIEAFGPPETPPE